MYWDTSAILKLYIAERDSSSFLDLIAHAESQVLSSAIASVEMLIVLHRKERSGDLKPGSARIIFEKFLDDKRQGRVIEIPFGPGVVEEARNLAKLVFRQPHPMLLRSLDAIHVSSAITAKARSIVATDVRLRQIALLTGLQVLP
jgi:predicted nucleic acid-binding protein